MDLVRLCQTWKSHTKTVLDEIMRIESTLNMYGSLVHAYQSMMDDPSLLPGSFNFHAALSAWFSKLTLVQVLTGRVLLAADEFPDRVHTNPTCDKDERLERFTGHIGIVLHQCTFSDELTCLNGLVDAFQAACEYFPIDQVRKRALKVLAISQHTELGVLDMKLFNEEKKLVGLA